MMDHTSGGSGMRTMTDINQLISEHISLAYHGKRTQIPPLNVKISEDLEPEAGEIEIVPQEIGRVILNLLSTAIRRADRTKGSS
jgi:hypothetical protein